MPLNPGAHDCGECRCSGPAGLVRTASRQPVRRTSDWRVSRVRHLQTDADAVGDPTSRASGALATSRRPWTDPIVTAAESF